MSQTKNRIIIVGGVAAGMSAAREHDVTIQMRKLLCLKSLGMSPMELADCPTMFRMKYEDQIN